MGRFRFGAGWDACDDERTVRDHDGEIPRALWQARRGRLWRQFWSIHDGPFDPDRSLSDVIMHGRSARDVLRVSWQYRFRPIPCFDPSHGHESRSYHRIPPELEPGRLIEFYGAAVDFWLAKYPRLIPFAVGFGNEIEFMPYTNEAGVLGEYERYARGFETIAQIVEQAWGSEVPIIVAGMEWRYWRGRPGLPSLAWWFGEQLRAGNIDVDPSRIILGWHASGSDSNGHITNGTRQLRRFGPPVAVTESVGEGPRDVERGQAAKDGGAAFYIAWARWIEPSGGWDLGDSAVECEQRFESPAGSAWSPGNAAAFEAAGRRFGEWRADLMSRDVEPPPPPQSFGGAGWPGRHTSRGSPRCRSARRRLHRPEHHLLRARPREPSTDHS